MQDWNGADRRQQVRINQSN